MSKAEEMLGRELGRINAHLPAARPTLRELVSEGDPMVRLRDGSEHHFRRGELERLMSFLDAGEDSMLRLPIILEINTTYRGYFRVRGRVEVKVIDKLLGTYDVLEEPAERLYPRYLLPRVRRELPTTTTYAFVVE